LIEQTRVDETLDLREYLAVLRARRWSILLVTFLVVGAALTFSFFQTPLYTAQARVLVAAPSGGFSGLINLETEREIAASEPVAALVNEDLGLDRPLDQLLSGVVVTGIAETEVLEVAYTSADRTEAQQLANSFAENYLEHRRSEALEVLVADQEALQQRIDNTSEQLTELSAELEQAQEDQNEALASTLETQQSIIIARLGVLQQQLDDMQTRRTSALPRGQVIEVAERPTAPSSPNHVTNGILAGLLGLALGVGFAFLRERLDDRFRGKGDLERLIEAPVVGTIPRFRPSRKGMAAGPITSTAPRGVAAEAYRGLRTNVQFLALQRGLKSILVTSPSAHEGKTLTTMNLAAVMAQTGNRVIVVSADLRRPTLESQIGASDVPERGLSTWLVSDEGGIETTLYDPGIPNLRLLPSGPTPPNPAELLTSPRLGALVEVLEANSDFVLFDSPPVLAVADASIIATSVGGTLIVVDARTTHRAAAQHARQEIERVGGLIVGAVLNSFEPGNSPYYYGPYDYGSEGLSDVSNNGGDETQARPSRPRARVSFRRS
jgi:capsular exopolysaccharide synthesis family protein